MEKKNNRRNMRNPETADPILDTSARRAGSDSNVDAVKHKNTKNAVPPNSANPMMFLALNDSGKWTVTPMMEAVVMPIVSPNRKTVANA